jgi:RHS repeat-associated protein
MKASLFSLVITMCLGALAGATSTTPEDILRPGALRFETAVPAATGALSRGTPGTADGSSPVFTPPDGRPFELVSDTPLGPGIGGGPDDTGDGGGSGSDGGGDSGGDDDDDGGDDGGDEGGGDEGGGDDGGSGGGGSSGGGSSGGGESAAERQERLDREAIAEATEGVMGEISAARDACSAYASSCASYDLVAAYRDNAGYTAEATRMAATVAGTTGAILTSGDRMYADIDENLSQRQARLRYRQDEQSAVGVGDPVRISDGAFLFEVPLPVIRYWGIKLDLTLRYDSARTEASPLGRGWWWFPAQRLVPGVQPIPDLEPLFAEGASAIATTAADLVGLEADAFGGRTGAYSAGEVDSLIREWTEILQLVRETAADFGPVEVLAAPYGDLDEEIASVRAELDTLAARLAGEIERFGEARDFRSSHATATATVAGESAALEEEQRRFAVERASWEVESDRQRAALPPGAESEQINLGAAASVLFGPYGATHTFTGSGSGLPSARTLPGYRATPPGAPSRYVESPTGIRSRFDENGRLARIEPAADRALVFLRDGAGRLTGICTEAGERLVSVSYVGAPGDGSMEIALPDIDPTTIHFADGQVRRIEGPRGSIDLEWQEGLLYRIHRDDGAWTAVTWSGTNPRRATAVEQSCGGRDRYHYGPGGRHVYTDPDGFETVYTLQDGLVAAVAYPSGLQRTWRFDANANPVEVRDNRGGGEDRRYDPEGRLIAVERTDGTWTRGRYDPGGRLIRLDGDRGLIFEREPGADGTVSAWTAADGARYTVSPASPEGEMTILLEGEPFLTVTLDGYGNPAVLERADGRREEVTTNLYGAVTRRMVDGVTVLERAFDRAGRLVGIVDGAGETRFLFDPAGNVVQTIRNGEALESTEFDPAGRPVEVRFSDGTVERTTWSDGGRVLSAIRRDGLTCDVRRDDAGRIRSIEERGGDRRWQFAHAPDGRINRIESTTDGTTSLLYSSAGAHVGFGYADGSVLRREYRSGGRIEVEGPDGDRSTVTVDAAGRVRSIDDGSRLTYRWNARSVALERDGNLLREVEFDRFGRVTRRRWPDGTSEMLAYGDHGRRITLTDRRGGSHEMTLDHHERPLRISGPDGAAVTFDYSPGRVIEEHNDGTTIEYLLDVDGSVRERRINGVVVADREVLPDGTIREALFARDGSLVTTRELDLHHNLRREWSSSGALLYSAEHPEERVLHLLEEGRSATQESVVPALSYRYRLGTDDPWTIERTILGRLSAVTAPDGSSRSVEWNPAGLPTRITEVDGAGTAFETRYRYDGDLLLERAADGAVPLVVEESEHRRRLTLAAGGARRVVTTDPYGVVTGETLSFSSDEATVASACSLDAAGRTVAATTSVAGSVAAHIGAITYGDAGRSMRFEAGGLTLEFARRTGAIVARIDGTEEIEITRGSTAVAGEIHTARRTAPGTAPGTAVETTVMRVGRFSGFVETVAAAVTIRNARGQIAAEHDLDGTFRLYRYDDAGRVTGASGSGTGTPVVVDAEIRRSVEDAWESAALSVAPPGVPPAVGVRSFPDTREQPAAPGPLREWMGLAIGHDPVTDLPDTLAVSAGDNPAVWTVRRDLGGNPLLVREAATGREWSAATVTWDTPLGVITVRNWESRPSGPGGTAGEVPRYRPGATRVASSATEVEPDGSASRSCIEVRRDHHLVAIIEATAIHVPFSDVRGSVHGVARLDRATGTVRYTPGPTLPPAIDPAFRRPGNPRGNLFPVAVPYDGIAYGMVHLPGTAALLSRTRLYIPATGRFTSRDPALHHLDWYLYAAGDPVNLIDPAGTIFTGARRDLSDTQQGGAWQGKPLGRSSRHTISSSGCVLTAVSNTINTVAGRRVTDPGTLNDDFMEGFYSGDALLSPHAAGEALAAVTGRHVEVVSFDPRAVDMARISATLANDASQEYAATARIQTYTDSPDGSRSFYEHTVNVAGFDQSGMPILVDTSNRNRVTLDAHETVLRYDVYAYSRCRSY